MIERREQMLLVISGPSGAGKGTLANMLLENDPSFSFSVSATTRARRETEIEGVHYFFISDQRFDELIEQKAFLELLIINGATALYSIARGKMEAISASVFLDGKIVLPFVNIIQFYHEKHKDSNSHEDMIIEKSADD